MRSSICGCVLKSIIKVLLMKRFIMHAPGGIMERCTEIPGEENQTGFCRASSLFMCTCGRANRQLSSSSFLL